MSCAEAVGPRPTCVSGLGSLGFAARSYIMEFLVQKPWVLCSFEYYGLWTLGVHESLHYNVPLLWSYASYARDPYSWKPLFL